MSMAKVADTNVVELFSSPEGGALLRDVLQHVFSPEDEEQALAAIAARMLDERAVCHVVGPTASMDCRAPPYPNGMVAITWTSPTSCAHCDSRITRHGLPESAVAVLKAAHGRGQPPMPGDALAFLTGPRIPTADDVKVRIFAAAVYDETAVFIDKEFESRPPTPRAEMMDRAGNTPFLSSAANCRTGPQCWVHGPNSRCVCE